MLLNSASVGSTPGSLFEDNEEDGNRENGSGIVASGIEIGICL